MDLTFEIASSIFDELSNMVDIPIYISNKSGEILAGSDQDLVGSVFREAQIAVATSDSVNLSEAVPKGLTGLACPIFYLNECVGAVVFAGKQANYEPYLHVVKFTVEMLLERSIHMRHEMHKQKLQEDWVINLFNPEYSDWSELERIAEALGIDTSNEAVVVVLHIRGVDRHNISSNQDLSFLENFMLQNANYRIKINYSCYLSNNLYVFSVSQNTAFAESNTKFKGELRSALLGLIQGLSSTNVECQIGIGEVGSSVHSHRCSFLQAKKSIDLSQQLDHPYPIMQIHDWGLFYFLSSIPQDIVDALAAQYLAKASNLKTELIQTVEAFFQNNCAVQKTADLLNIHKNTLLYRLKCVREISTLDPKNFEDAVVLHLLLHLRKLYPDLMTKTSGHQLNDD